MGEIYRRVIWSDLTDCGQGNKVECFEHKADYINWVIGKMKETPAGEHDLLSHTSMRQSDMFNPYPVSDVFPDFKFDVSQNIQHNTYVARDSGGKNTCSSGNDIGYDECNMDAMVGEIRERVEETYKINVFDTVSSDGGKQAWDSLALVKSDEEERLIVSWAETGHKAHVTGMLDTSICEKANLFGYGSVCYGEDNSPINPWVGGDFNAYIGCDTSREITMSEVIDDACLGTLCEQFRNELVKQTQGVGSACLVVTLYRGSCAILMCLQTICAMCLSSLWEIDNVHIDKGCWGAAVVVEKLMISIQQVASSALHPYRKC